MKYRHLGKAGIQVSELSFGSWVTFHTQSGIESVTSMMAAAYDAGVNFFDNAEGYAGGKSEEIMGAALRKLGWRRGSYLVSTKLFWGLNEGPNQQNTLNRKYLLESIDGSLVRLDLDYVDLLFCHRADPTTPIEETVWAMHNIIERGKALYWGTSEWEAEDILSAIDIAERHHLHKPVVEQPVYNLFQRHRFGPDYERVYKDFGYGSTTWSPLASGLLTGKYNKGIPRDSRGAVEGLGWLQKELTDAEKLAKVSALEPIAEKMGASLAQLSLAWCLQNPYVSTVMTGASRVEQVQENMKALDFVDRFTPDVMNEIDGIFGAA
ncbi:MAG: aldo/keto reductase [Gammaproteobacteria bacterium]|nr:aldo/keto reductase [Gammaproteobacteria bacterium]MBT8110325.1 aldo/keto reductase [Gammaproteobacteria bacterium]NND47672.1 aldo/keto reductase [Woeseiaceae bacterium]NNL45028.1 aldo/keto reductase [Woeseiaceae bacterium]